MENKNTKVCGMETCSDCGCGHHHMHILKWILKIGVVVILFSFVFKMGEIRGILESRGYEKFNYRHNAGMMRYGNDYGSGFETGILPDAPTVIPATPSAPVTPKK